MRLLPGLLAATAFAVSPQFHPPRDDARDRLFNDGWRFHRGDAPGAEAPDFDDAGWRAVTLPHDWSIEPIPEGELKGMFDLNPVRGKWKWIESDDNRHADPATSTRSWKSVELPGLPADFKPKTYRWFRREIELTPEMAAAGVTILAGRIDDADEFWINGQKVGDTGVMPKYQPQGECISAADRERQYRVPPSMLKPGANTLAFCVYNDRGKGGFVPPKKHRGEHDVLFETAGPFISNAVGQTHSGYTVGGTGWYRKRFEFDAGRGAQATLRFGGVMMNSDVWLNGEHLGFWPYGYTGFYYDLTPHLRDGGNVLAVRVRNEGITSRWYPGSGIYRNVWLTQTAPTRVRPWGVWAKTLSAGPDKATVEVDVELAGPLDGAVVKLSIVDAGGDAVASAFKPVEGPTTTFTLPIDSPKLWDLDTPHLHTAQVEVLRAGKTVDRFDQDFGIRTLRFTPEEGFQLNGRRVNMIGGCVHHDNGLIGAMAPARADIRKMEILKREGYNAVRAAHNPMTTDFYAACDRLGLLVMDEVFDVWGVHKTPQDYGGEAWYEGRARDIENWCRRTRNHPSIVIRSLGNEIGNKHGDQVLQDLVDLLAMAKRWDDTRPYTGGSARIADNVEFMGKYDVPGYNYREEIALANHERFPDWVMIGTESMPMPSKHMESINFVRDHDWFTGCFVWSAFEYIGESWSGWTGTNREKSRGWPSYAAGCGLIDISGFPKGGQVFRRVAMGASPIEINVLEPLPEGLSWRNGAWSWPNEYPSWGWHGFEGREVEVKVVTYAPRARLTLNGTVVGTQAVDRENIHTVFKLPYEPGTLVAEGLDANGKVLHRTELKTPGEAAALRAVPDRPELTTHGNDLAYVSLEVADAAGNLVMQGRHDVSVTVEGPAEILGCGSGFHKDIHSFGNPGAMKTWRGRAMLILRPTGEPGTVTIKPAAAELSTEPFRLRVIETRAP